MSAEITISIKVFIESTSSEKRRQEFILIAQTSC